MTEAVGFDSCFRQRSDGVARDGADPILHSTLTDAAYGASSSCLRVSPLQERASDEMARTPNRQRRQQKSRAALGGGRFRNARLNDKLIVVPRSAEAYTPDGVSLYARWLLSRVSEAGRRVLRRIRQ